MVLRPCEPGPSSVLPKIDGTGLTKAEAARVEGARDESVEPVKIARLTKPACRNLNALVIGERDAKYELAHVFSNRPSANPVGPAAEPRTAPRGEHAPACQQPCRLEPRP